MIRLINAAGAQITLPPTMFLSKVPFDLYLGVQRLYGKNGAVVTGKSTLMPREFSLEGRIYYPNDKERIRMEADELLLFLMSPPIKVYQGDRFLHSYPLGAPQHWIDGGIELDLQIPMIAPDPYWYGDEISLTISSAQTIEVTGNAVAVPFIETTSSMPDLSVKNSHTGQEIKILGANGKVEIDNFNHSITVDGERRVDLGNDEWLVHGFSLLPGENLITTNKEIKLIYRPRWL